MAIALHACPYFRSTVAYHVYAAKDGTNETRYYFTTSRIMYVIVSHEKLRHALRKISALVLINPSKSLVSL